MRPYIAVLLLAFSTCVHAGACDSLRTQLDENECANENFQKADQQLNQVYSAYRKRLPASQQAQLKAAQVAWLKFRDASCVFESSGVEGGSAHTMIYLNCLAGTTTDRIKSLQTLASCEEGDLSCPAPK